MIFYLANQQRLSQRNKWQTFELSSLTSTVDSYGFYTETSASNSPASNPTPFVYSMLTEDQKLAKLFDIMDQINKEGKYLWYVEKELNKIGQYFYSYTITNLELMINDPMYWSVMLCWDSSNPTYYFNCKDVNKDLFGQVIPLIHHNAKLSFFNINHITRNDIDILDTIFLEYFMSNYKTTLNKSYIFFFPEEYSDQGIYNLSKTHFLLNFINNLSKNFMKSNTTIMIQNIMLTYDELIPFLLSWQWPTVQFNNCLILISKCSTNKLKRSIIQKWKFYKWNFENQTSIDGKNNFMYSISQNPYFFKSLINFEIEEIDGARNMFSSYITSNKSRSLIYRFMFARLRELVRSKTLNHKYDDQHSSLQIDIWENYYFWCIVNKDRDMVINLDLWKFILTKIWNSIYNYLMLHRWFIPSKIESRIKSMMKYMKKYKHSENIIFKDVIFYHKLNSKSLIDTLFNLIAWSSFSEISLQISFSDISNCIWTTFSKIMKLHSLSIQKVVILKYSKSSNLE